MGDLPFHRRHHIWTSLLWDVRKAVGSGEDACRQAFYCFWGDAMYHGCLCQSISNEDSYKTRHGASLLERTYMK